MNKHLNRHTHATWLLVLVGFLIVSVVVLAFNDKITSEFNFALGAILGYAGNHTYNNMRTSPTKDDSDT